MKKLLILFVFSQLTLLSYSQIYKDSTQPIDNRVQDLLSRMTLEEKFWQVFMIPSDGDTTGGKFKHGIFGLQVSAGGKGDAGGQLLSYNTNQTAREVAQKVNELQLYFTTKTHLGIPIIPFDEALHGLVRQGATAFPQSIALAATFDTTLMNQIAGAIAEECKDRGIRHILSPVINLATDVRWGRTEETYGEDPYLTTQMGIAFIQSFENRGIIATPKHFVANVGAGGRDSYPIFDSEWSMNQSHFLPFIGAFQQAGARSVMTAYNAYNGTACSANEWLLTKKLKQDWEFKGFVISDANAVGGEVVLHQTAKTYAESGAHAINAGLDVIFQTDYSHAALFYPAFTDGSIDEKRLNDAVSRVLRAKFELGLFENPFIPLPDTMINSEHRVLAQKAAEESFVLLQNKNALLPLLSPDTRIALFGEDAVLARLGGYSGPGIDPISILEGLKESFTTVNYQEVVSYSDTLFKPIPSHLLHSNGSEGLTGTYYINVNFEGNPAFTRVDKTIDFLWTLFGPNEQTGNHFYSVKWNGEFTAPESGNYSIGLSGNDGYKLYIDDKLLIDRSEKTGFHTDLVPIEFKKGKSYPLRIEFIEPKGHGNIQLIWNYENQSHFEKELNNAKKLVKKSDVAIVVAGIHEGEFQDRASLALPGNQEKLIHELHALGKPVIVLLVGGSAITMDSWIDETDAVVCLWYPGEAGGKAVANLISGKINPAGRLPITYPISEAQLPLTYNHMPTGRSDNYHNLSGEPLFPFGYGLSYTSFAYGKVLLSLDTIRTNSTSTITFELTNTGKFAGDEVVQLYIKPIHSALAQPILRLARFQRIFLKPGQKTPIEFQLPATLFETLTASNEWKLEAGEYEILIGSSSKNFKLLKRIVVIP